MLIDAQWGTEDFDVALPNVGVRHSGAPSAFVSAGWSSLVRQEDDSGYRDADADFKVVG